MILGGLRKTTLIDYPGHIASMVFTRGCTFACPWCHNGALLEQGEPLDQEMVLNFLKKRRKVIDGVVVSGGEPTMHKDLPQFLALIREMGLLVKLDTNGSFPDRLEAIFAASLVDYVAMDVKAPLEDLPSVTGVSGYEEQVRRSIDLIMNRAPDYEFRTTFVPGLHDVQSAKGIGRLIAGAKIHYLQYFRPVGTILDPSYQKIRQCTKEELETYAAAIRPYVGQVICRI